MQIEPVDQAGKQLREPFTYPGEDNQGTAVETPMEEKVLLVGVGGAGSDPLHLLHLQTHHRARAKATAPSLPGF